MMTLDQSRAADKATPWSAGSNGARKRNYFVSRHLGGGRGGESLVDARGRVRWFASIDAARKAATIANRNNAQPLA